MRLPAAIGIVGGMGPWVDPLLLAKLLEYQASLGMRKDQQAIPVLLAQYAALIEDRSEYLAALAEGRACENPAVPVAHLAAMLAAAGARVLGIPCNTFHSPAIFDVFRRELAALGQEAAEVQVIHMIEATLDAMVQAHPQARRIGILSTNGTYLQRIYTAPLAARGFQAITLPYQARIFSLEQQAARKDAIINRGAPPLQNDVHHAINNPEWGVKSGRGAAQGFPEARAVLKAAARELVRAGADLLIMGCTEVPLALGPDEVPGVALLDPLDVLARSLVDAWRARFSPAWPAARELPFLAS